MAKIMAQIMQRKPGLFRLEILDGRCKEIVEESENPVELNLLAREMGYSEFTGNLVDLSASGLRPVGDIKLEGYHAKA